MNDNILVIATENTRTVIADNLSQDQINRITAIASEPKKPKPLLADAQVGWVCKHRNGVWSQIIDTNGTYIPGQPVRTTLKDSNGINRNFCLSGCHFTMQFGGEYDIIHTEPLAEEGTAEWAWQMLKLGKKMWHPAEQSMETTALDKDRFVACHAKTGWQLYAPQPQFEVGDYAEHILDKSHWLVRESTVPDMVETVCLSSGQVEWWGQVEFPKLFRILQPSEVKVSLTLSGTVEKVEDTGCFLLNVGNEGIAYCLDYESLTPSQAEMVRGLTGGGE